MTTAERAFLLKRLVALDYEVRVRHYAPPAEADHLDLADKTPEQIEAMERAMGFRSLDAYESDMFSQPAVGEI